MTEYPVQCFDNNGEPYGRYCNPYNPSPNSISVKDSGDPDFASIVQHNAGEFEAFAQTNTFPFPSGTIGKTYQRDGVEVVTEFKDGYLPEWKKTIVPGYHKDLDNPTRKAFYLVDRLIPQPVEKEPEPLISSRQYIEQVYGTSTFARSIECKDAESLMDMMDDFLDWAMQKKQEASQ